MKVDIKYVDSNKLGSCPAEIDMATGVVSINKDVWDEYDDFEQKFIILHELGHYTLQTDSETEADKYALQNCYKTAPQSLKRSLQTLYKVGIIDTARMWQLYINSLYLDSQDGNEAATLELFNINNNIQNLENMGQKGKETYIEKGTNRSNRIDGEETIIKNKKDRQRGHKKNGVAIGGVYFSITNILLVAVSILLIVLVAQHKKSY